MPISVNGANGITFADGSIQNTGASGFGFKNRIINGAMVIDQRNAGASTNNAGSATTYSLDRWAYYGPSSSKFSIQQSSTAPVDFVNSLLITSLAATSMSASTQYLLRQAIEGYNIADLNWGSANAKNVTLSFWVRSSLTGAFGGSITNGDVNRSYPFSYTISSANTWEQKSVTITGPTSGTWNTANGTGLRLYFALGAGSDYNGTAGAWATVSDVTYPTGSTNILGTNGATFYITGVQLEKGSTATAFDYRDFGREFIMCQRYYQRCWDYGTATGTVVAGPVGGTWQYNQYSFFLGTGNYGINCGTPFPTVMRATPTITIYSAANGTAGSVTPWNSSDYSITSNGGFVNASTTRITGASYNNGTTAGLVYAFYWTAAAEL